MPVLYPIAVINFAFLYWIYKALLLKQYQKTTSFNQDLPFVAIYFFKVGLILHMAWTLFIFTETQLLTIDVTAAVGAFSKAYAEKYEETRAKMLAGVAGSEETSIFSGDRFATGVGILYIFFLLFAAAFYVFRSTFIALLIKAGESLCPRCFQLPAAEEAEEAKDAELASGLDTYSRDFLADLRVGTLADKYRKSVVDLHDAQQYEVDERSMMNQQLKDALVDVLKRRLR